MAHHRGRIDDRTGFACRDHSARNALGDEEGGLNVDVGDEIEVGFRHVGHRTLPVDAGIVEQNVERRLFAEGPLDRFHIADIEREGRSLASRGMDPSRKVVQSPG